VFHKFEGVKHKVLSMTKHISFLRGINVGGHRKIKMVDLKTMFEKAGFTKVQTYIQSGNVIFESADNLSGIALSEKLEQRIAETFGFEVPVIVRNHSALQKAIANNPFFSDEVMDKLHLTLLKEETSKENLSMLVSDAYLPDKFSIIGTDVFIYCEGKYHATKLSNSFFERKLNMPATTRNWKTILKLLELA
jgi:uncharacterized protein (DUF1697 family)